MTKRRAPTGWRLLVISLPSSRATVRMRVWRALKTLGAVVLRDGVYLLPDRDATQTALSHQAIEVERAGGTAQVLQVDAAEAGQDSQFRALFDRSGDYAHLLQAARKLKSSLGQRRYAAAAPTMKRLRRDYASIHSIDYFPGPAAVQAGELLTELELALTPPGEPQSQSGRIPRLNRSEYRGRTWATRARPWVDRIASAWLIRRHIDPRAKFLWLKVPKHCPKRALGFDFDGATFSHVGARVTFETLLASFGLESDEALLRVGALVHYLDVGGVPVAEAAGIESILRGMRAQQTDDNKFLAEACSVFDHLYFSYQKE